MTAKEIFDHLLAGANKVWEVTGDVLIAGDENKTVHKAGTCFKLTAEVLAKAMAAGVDMMITHEPTFSHGDVRDNGTPTDRKKWEMLDESNITLYRFHDHAHDTEPDYIHAGFIKALDLKIKQNYTPDSFAVRRYELEEPMTVRELALRMKEKLGLAFVRIVGKDDYPVKDMCLGLGSVGAVHVELLHDPGCDVFITGEVGEVCTCEYIRDASFFGDNKAVLILGHYGAEYAGMQYLAEQMNASLVPTEYFDCGEVYHSVTSV